MLAHEILREHPRAAGLFESQIAAADFDEIVVPQGAKSYALKVKIEDVEVLVALVELDAENGGGRRIVP